MQTIKKRGAAVNTQPEQEIVTLAHKISDKLSKYRQAIVIIASVVAAVLILTAGYKMMQSQKEQQAAPLVAAAYEIYSPSNGSPADYGKALELFREIAKKFSSTPSGSMARYYAGNCLVALGKNDEAIKEYLDLTNRNSGEKFIVGLAYQRLGFAYQAQGKQADALKAFEQAENLLGPGVATVELAKLYEAAGNKAESEKKYKTVLDKLGGTSWGMEAMGKVQKIAPTPQPAAGAQTK